MRAPYRPGRLQKLLGDWHMEVAIIVLVLCGLAVWALKRYAWDPSAPPGWNDTKQGAEELPLGRELGAERPVPPRLPAQTETFQPQRARRTRR